MKHERRITAGQRNFAMSHMPPAALPMKGVLIALGISAGVWLALFTLWQRFAS